MFNVSSSYYSTHQITPFFKGMKSDLEINLSMGNPLNLSTSDGLNWRLAKQGSLLEGIAATGRKGEVYRVIVHTSEGVKAKPKQILERGRLVGVAPSAEQIAVLESRIKQYLNNEANTAVNPLHDGHFLGVWPQELMPLF